MNAIVRLDTALKAVCPIYGVSVGDPQDKATWRIDFKPEATQGQREAAAQVMAAFIWTDEVVDATQQENAEQSAARARADLKADIERKLALGATPEDILKTMLQLL